MTAFRILLVVLWTIIVVYTGIVIENHGWGLLEIFFRDMAAMGWPGQFNLDFTSLLTLSALWVAWRHDFSIGGLALALLAFFGGGLFLTTYLFVVSTMAKGDMKQLLLGKVRATSG